MDYLCANFGDFIFSCFVFIDSCGQTDRITDAVTHATTDGVKLCGQQNQDYLVRLEVISSEAEQS